MAELHGRVFGFSNRLTVLAAVASLWVAAGHASAEPPPRDRRPSEPNLFALRAPFRPDEIGRWGRTLGATDEDARQRAFDRLTHLPAEALPAIGERIEELGLGEFRDETARSAIAAIRHETGSRRADDMIDIAPGILPRLEHERGELTVKTAEALCLLRSLERIGTTEAGRIMADLFGTNYTAWKWESRRVVDRMGLQLLPALVEARGHPRSGARRWSRWGVAHLEVGRPAVAVRAAEDRGPRVLADLLRAYGRVRDMDAMPVLVSFVDSRQRSVRDAARWAVERYGRNIVWQLRRIYRNETGESAKQAWGWRRTKTELYEVVDDARLAPARKALDAGLAAYERGALSAMRRHFDRVLRLAPEIARRDEMAPGWAALGRRQRERGDPHAAARSYRRAVALAPDAPDKGRWKAQWRFAEAEARRADGLVDLDAYRRVHTLDPTHEAAGRRIEVLSGAAAARKRERRRLASAAAAVLLTVAGIGLLWRRRRPERYPAEDGGNAPSPEATPEARCGAPEPDTVPG